LPRNPKRRAALSNASPVDNDDDNDSDGVVDDDGDNNNDSEGIMNDDVRWC